VTALVFVLKYWKLKCNFLKDANIPTRAALVNIYCQKSVLM